MHAVPRRHCLDVQGSSAHRNGLGRPEDIDLLNSVLGNIAGQPICALGDAAAFPVQSFLKHFGSEFEYHIEHKTCLVPKDRQWAVVAVSKIPA